MQSRKRRSGESLDLSPSLLAGFVLNERVRISFRGRPMGDFFFSPEPNFLGPLQGRGSSHCTFVGQFLVETGEGRGSFHGGQVTEVFVFQLYLVDKDCVKQLKIFSLDGPDWPECQVNNVDQQRPGHRGENQVSSPLDHIGGWPRGDQGFHAPPLHTSASTSRTSGRRSTFIWRTVASS